MGDLTPHFSRSEMECKCGCGLMNMKDSTMQMLERVRLRYGAPMTINSACRCPARNEAEGGKPGSAHPDGYAVDAKVANGRQRWDLVDAAIEVGFNRIGIAKGFVHLDNHPDKFPNVIWSY